MAASAVLGSTSTSSSQTYPASYGGQISVAGNAFASGLQNTLSANKIICEQLFYTTQTETGALPVVGASVDVAAATPFPLITAAFTTPNPPSTTAGQWTFTPAATYTVSANTMIVWKSQTTPPTNTFVHAIPAADTNTAASAITDGDVPIPGPFPYTFAPQSLGNAPTAVDLTLEQTWQTDRSNLYPRVYTYTPGVGPGTGSIVYQGPLGSVWTGYLIN